MTRCPQFPQQRNDRRLGVHIHAGKRFVQQNHAPALGQRPRQKNPFPLPARQFADLPLAKVQHADPRETLLRDAPILRARCPHKIHVAVTPHQDHVPHAHRKTPVDLLGLRHVGHEVLFQRRLHRPARDRHRARRRLEQPHNRLEQRRLPAAVHAHQRTDRAAFERKRRRAQRHVPVGITHRDVTDAHAHFSGERVHTLERQEPACGRFPRRATAGVLIRQSGRATKFIVRETLSRSCVHCSPSISNTSGPGPSHPSTSRRRARRRNAPPFRGPLAAPVCRSRYSR